MKPYNNKNAREEILSTEGDPFTLLNAYNAWLQVRLMTLLYFKYISIITNEVLLHCHAM